MSVLRGRIYTTDEAYCTGAFLAAAVWGGQPGGQMCIWGRARIPDDIMYVTKL